MGSGPAKTNARKYKLLVMTVSCGGVEARGVDNDCSNHSDKEANQRKENVGHFHSSQHIHVHTPPFSSNI